MLCTSVKGLNKKGAREREREKERRWRGCERELKRERIRESV